MRPLVIILLLTLAVPQGSEAEQVWEAFDDDAGARWEYVADGVMGGVSQGDAQIATEDGTSFLRLTGIVSTANNGGFIQARRLLPDGFPASTEGLRLVVRGNGEPYYLFIRTGELTRPWYFYSARFDTAPDWSELRIPLTAFERSHAHLAAAIDPASVISLGVVAYGRDHAADLSVGMIELY